MYRPAFAIYITLNLIHMDQNVLSAIADFLNAGGLNYTVFLRAYSTPHGASEESSQLISDALGKQVVVRWLGDVSSDEVISEIMDALSYPGDDGAGPDQAAVKSDRFSELLNRVVDSAKATSSKANRIQKFRFDEGHPAYPVFWDFAFLFTSSDEATVLVGSSSD